MASKHLDGLLQAAVPSREETVALGRVDIRKDWRQRVVAHKGPLVRTAWVARFYGRLYRNNFRTPLSPPRQNRGK
jgi:hypothetical protein